MQILPKAQRFLIPCAALMLMAILAACSGTQPRQSTTIEEPTEKVEGLEQSENKSEAPEVGKSAMGLLEQARQYAEAGDGEKAAEALERAIGIEPNNPWLWHRLAVLRMQQKYWKQAIALANRSIQLARGNKRLIGGNWLVISMAEEGIGNADAAKQAKKKSATYLGETTEE